jgi:predicted DNA-binding transcriptional regulator YafY
MHAHFATPVVQGESAIFHMTVDVIIICVAAAKYPTFPAYSIPPPCAAQIVCSKSFNSSVADLQHQGVPIEGEAGVGYRLGQGFELPPFMFTVDEARALVASVCMAQVWQDPALAQASDMALSKILSVLPTTARAAAQSMAVYAPPVGLEPAAQATLQTLREAAQGHCKLQLHYRDATDALSQRTVRPLGCFYWGRVWTLGAWCESREDFRSFRLDRMAQVQVLEGAQGRFADEPGKTLADYLRAVAPTHVQATLTGDL